MSDGNLICHTCGYDTVNEPQEQDFTEPEPKAEFIQLVGVLTAGGCCEDFPADVYACPICGALRLSGYQVRE